VVRWVAVIDKFTKKHVFRIDKQKKKVIKSKKAGKAGLE